MAEGEGKTHHVNLGGENVLQSVLSKTTFGGLRNWGWSVRCLFPLREMTESRPKRGGGNGGGGGGPKTFWGAVLRYACPEPIPTGRHFPYRATQ